MEDDWDLHAVVRGCTAITAPPAATNNTRSFQAPHTHHQACNFSASCFQDLLEPRRNGVVQEKPHDLYKPFFPKSEIPFSPPISTLSALTESQDPPPPPPLPLTQIVKHLTPQNQLRPKQQSFSVSNCSKTSASHSPSPRSKRRKSHTKKVCHLAAENLSSDVWSWRKYGQKPIKGSPYPRGYYRCSTSKGCMARKQVERNRSDPAMFIVTYTAEHSHQMPTHRNSLAGSTRQKPAEAPSTADPSKNSLSPEILPASSLSQAPEKLESSREENLAEDDDGGEFSVSEMALDDDFFAGLEDFTAAAPDAGDFTSGCLQFPWLSASATTTTTAGGG